MTSRRAFLIGGLAALAAPAVIRTAGLLMPVRKIVRVQKGDWIEYSPDEVSWTRIYTSGLWGEPMLQTDDGFIRTGNFRMPAGAASRFIRMGFDA